MGQITAREIFTASPKTAFNLLRSGSSCELLLSHFHFPCCETLP